MKFFCNTKRTDTVQFKYTKIRSLKNYFVIITDFAQIQIFLFTQKKKRYTENSIRERFQHQLCSVNNEIIPELVNLNHYVIIMHRIGL